MTNIKKPKRDWYAGDLILALRDDGPVSDAVRERLLWFLTKRLTEAARTSCHHCDDVQATKGAPCWWCGLKVR